MNSRSMALCIVITVLCEFAHAQQPVCHNSGSGRDSAVCAYAKLAKADAQLNDAYLKALDLLGSVDGADAKVALVAAQRAWVKFRDADCHVQDRIFQNGTMCAALVGSCLKDRTEQRTKELKEIWLP
jgi:uncharacterized protein YecT (DUF1311 family)